MKKMTLMISGLALTSLLALAAAAQTPAPAKTTGAPKQA